MRHWPSLLTLLLALPLGCAPASGAASARPVVPDVPLTTVAGDSTDLVKVASGRVAVVSLWATWCDGCLREMDALVRLDAQARHRGDAVVIGVAEGEEPGKVDAFARQRGLAYPQLVDPDFRLADWMGERSIPATLILDRRGRVVFRGSALDEAALAALRAALGAP
ncbi:MAG TPA: TlpA disulfide reductase family protein [Polyangiaceae bacterium]|jgi:peroxiredoxin